jgi:hypothetical protein
MTWDISPQHEQEYFEFVVREFIPGVQRLGLELNDAWATVFGSHPQILVGAVIPEGKEASSVLNTPEWNSLHNQLMDYVINYEEKLVNAQGGFQF